MAKKPAKHDKKKILMKGAGMHLVSYMVIALILNLFGVPDMIIFLTLMVLFWGLIVLSYAFYYEK